MDKPEIDLLSKIEAYRGYLRLEKFELRHRRFDGRMSAPMEREVMERGRVVGLLPYDPKSDNIILIEQFRIGAYRAEREPWQIEIVAGVLEDGEAPQEVARRETLEETGRHLGRIHHIGDFLVSPGCSTEEMHLYLGEVKDGAALPADGHFGLEDEHEDIRAFTLSADEAFSSLRDGRFTNFPIVLALQWFESRHKEFQRLWDCPT